MASSTIQKNIFDAPPMTVDNDEYFTEFHVRIKNNLKVYEKRKTDLRIYATKRKLLLQHVIRLSKINGIRLAKLRSAQAKSFLEQIKRDEKEIGHPIGHPYEE